MRRDAEFLKNISPVDEVDWDVVKKVVVRYFEKYPDIELQILEHIKEKRAEMDAHGNEYGIVNSESQMRQMYALPACLVEGLSKKYPKLFLDNRHVITFCKMFPKYRLPTRL